MGLETAELNVDAKIGKAVKFSRPSTASHGNCMAGVIVRTVWNEGECSVTPIRGKQRKTRVFDQAPSSNSKRHASRV